MKKSTLLPVILGSILFTSCTGKHESIGQTTQKKQTVEEQEQTLKEADQLILQGELEKSIELLNNCDSLNERSYQLIQGKLSFTDKVQKILSQVSSETEKNKIFKLILKSTNDNFNGIGIGYQSGINTSSSEYFDVYIPFHQDQLSIISYVHYSNSKKGKVTSCRVIPEISIKSSSGSLKLGMGFGADPDLPYYYFPEFDLTKKRTQLEKICNRQNVRIIIKSALTYHDAALYNNQVWDLNECEAREFKDKSIYHEWVAMINRKGQYFDHGYSLTEEKLNQIYNILELFELLYKNNIKI